MSLTVEKKINVGKAVLIVLAVLGVCLSLLDCKQGVAITGLDFDGKPISTTYSHNAFSIIGCVLAGIQILLVWNNRFKLQMIPAILSSANIILLPVVVELQNFLKGSIVYIRAPTGESAVRQWEVTSAGYVYVTMGWLLLVMSVFAAWRLTKLKGIVTRDPNMEERNEATR